MFALPFGYRINSYFLFYYGGFDSSSKITIVFNGQTLINSENIQRVVQDSEGLRLTDN